MELSQSSSRPPPKSEPNPGPVHKAFENLIEAAQSSSGSIEDSAARFDQAARELDRVARWKLDAPFS